MYHGFSICGINLVMYKLEFDAQFFSKKSLFKSILLSYCVSSNICLSFEVRFVGQSISVYVLVKNSLKLDFKLNGFC